MVWFGKVTALLRLEIELTATSSDESTPVLDLRGLRCPKPALRTKKHVEKMRSGEAILIVCTDPLSVIDIPHLVRTLGHKLLETQEGMEEFHFLVQKT